MEGIIHAAPGGLPGWLGTLPGGALIFAVYPGFLAALTLALASSWLSQHYGAPVMLFGLLFGMAFHFPHEDGRCVAGIEFSSRTILVGVLAGGAVAIAALGMKTSFKDLFAVGRRPIGLMLAETAWIALLVLAVVEFGSR